MENIWLYIGLVVGFCAGMLTSFVGWIMDLIFGEPK